MKILSTDVGYRNLAYCLLEDGKVVEWEVVDVIKEGSDTTPVLKNGSDPAIIGLLVRSLWKRRSSLLSVEVVVCERQPPRARVMRVLEGAIHAFFQTCREAASEENPCKVVRIEPFSARDKFKEYEKRGEVKGRKQFGARKKACVQLCREYLEETNQPLEQFDKAKKRDDLADALMQGVMFFKSLPKDSKAD